MSGRSGTKRTLKIGSETFKRFSLTTRKKSFKHGGWSGIVLFVDRMSNDKVVGRTMHLNKYLDDINFTNVKNGRFGKTVRDIALSYLEVYYFEVKDFTKIRDYQNYFRREITKSNKANTEQLELNFSSRKKKEK